MSDKYHSKEKSADSLVVLAIAGLLTIIGLIVIYGVWMIISNEAYLPSTDTADWGAFGDFVGGIANPVIALLALIGLIRAIKLQQSEFNNMKAQLEDQVVTLEKQHQHTEFNAYIENANKAFTEVFVDLERLSTETVEFQSIKPNDTRNLIYYMNLWQQGAHPDTCEHYDSPEVERLFKDLFELLIFAGEIFEDIARKYPKESSVFIKYRQKKLKRWAELSEYRGYNVNSYQLYGGPNEDA